MSELLLAYSWYDLLHFLPTTPSGWAWFCFGLSGNVTFSSRFIVQWLYSEIHKESRVPVIFWYQSMLGTLILLIYFTHQRELIGMLGYIFNIIPYTRNLILVYRKQRLDKENAANVQRIAPAAPE